MGGVIQPGALSLFLKLGCRWKRGRRFHEATRRSFHGLQQRQQVRPDYGDAVGVEETRRDIMAEREGMAQGADKESADSIQKLGCRGRAGSPDSEQRHAAGR